jgi:CheY-like chemotaxis protein
MSELLIVAASPSDLTQLEQLSTSHNITFKSALDVHSALEWLKRRQFSIAFVDSEISINDQQKIADGLWRANPAANYLVYNFHKELDAKKQELRLFGAEVAMGKNALSVLEKALVAGKDRPALDQDKFSILVVEDLDSPRDIICFYLESLGYKSVTGKSSAKEAMTELENNPNKYSCVMTDIRMPNIAGNELIAYIRAHPRLNQLPVIVLTAYGLPTP